MELVHDVDSMALDTFGGFPESTYFDEQMTVVLRTAFLPQIRWRGWNGDEMRSLRVALEIRACRYDQHSVLNLKHRSDVHLPISGFYAAQPQTRKARKG